MAHRGTQSDRQPTRDSRISFIGGGLLMTESRTADVPPRGQGPLERYHEGERLVPSPSSKSAS